MLAAIVAAGLAWVDPGHQLSPGAQGIVVAALSLTVAILHWVQTYHRINYTPPAPAPLPPAANVVELPPAAPRVGA